MNDPFNKQLLISNQNQDFFILISNKIRLSCQVTTDLSDLITLAEQIYDKFSYYNTWEYKLNARTKTYKTVLIQYNHCILYSNRTDWIQY